MSKKNMYMRRQIDRRIGEQAVADYRNNPNMLFEKAMLDLLIQREEVEDWLVLLLTTAENSIRSYEKVHFHHDQLHVMVWNYRGSYLTAANLMDIFGELILFKNNNSSEYRLPITHARYLYLVASLEGHHNVIEQEKARYPKVQPYGLNPCLVLQIKAMLEKFGEREFRKRKTLYSAILQDLTDARYFKMVSSLDDVIDQMDQKIHQFDQTLVKYGSFRNKLFRRTVCRKQERVVISGSSETR